jgi:CheY-like chemotaxis protein
VVTATDASSRLHRILVVEDEEAVAEGLRLLLEQEYVVDLAASGQQALELLLGHRVPEPRSQEPRSQEPRIQEARAQDGRAQDGRPYEPDSSAAAPFDAVLCDLMMPGMSGIELYRALKVRAPGMEERLVFMTGGAFTTEAEAFLDEVSNARVEKPFDFASVDRLLRHAVAIRRS